METETQTRPTLPTWLLALAAVVLVVALFVEVTVMYAAFQFADAIHPAGR
jgi:hypothetical protein